MVFEIPELIAEICREEGFEPEDAPRCLSCEAVLDNQPRGRTRRFCNNKGRCKQAHHRKTQREAQRAAILQEHAELRDMWEKHHIGGELLPLLQNILIDQGEEQARAATDAIIHYAQQEQATRTQQPQEPEELPTRKWYFP